MISEKLLMPGFVVAWLGSVSISPQYYFLFLRQNIKRAEQAKGATAFEGFTRLCALSQ